MYDAIIIGSGIGGSMAAHQLVRAGWRVLLLERGPRVARGPQNWEPTATLELTTSFSKESAYRAIEGGYGPEVGGVFCLGGPSVYFGAAAVRYREADFTPDSEIVGDSGAEWPYTYDDLEPYYGQAERVMGVAGDDTHDPTRPKRSAPYPQAPAPLAAVSERFRDAARALGLSPSALPLAINYDGNNGRRPCELCRTCDTFACAVEAKNDMASAVLLPLERRGAEIRTDTVATRLVASQGRIETVQAWDKSRNEPVAFQARHVVLAAGALGSPHLLLASGLDRLHPSGGAVGKYLTRHCAAMVFGFCNFRPDPAKAFHKQLIVFDYYFGDPRTRRFRSCRIGTIQQISPPAPALMKAYMARAWDRVPLGGFVEHLTSALVMAEDEPREANRVAIDPAETDVFGLPRLCITHRYTRRDRQRRALLVRRAKRILRGVGAWSFYTHHLKTFSHSLGTVRMGSDPAHAPLDGVCRFRGVENLLVVDGSALPTAAGVNPCLTIAANALRAADHLVKGEPR
jgi:choline dehydrogenase-like flavoprotein